MASVAAALGHARSLLAADPALAAVQAREILQVVPDQADASLLLGSALRRMGDLAGAQGVLQQLIQAHPEAAIAWFELGMSRLEAGDAAGAAFDLERAATLAPALAAAQLNLAMALYRSGEPRRALEPLDRLLRREPGSLAAHHLRAAARMAVGEAQAAIEDYRAVLAVRPGEAYVWLTLGHALKTVGRQAEAVAAYRESLRIAPHLGEAWWSLANLKTVRFAPADITAMRAQLARRDLGEEDRTAFEFALAKALEDAGDFAAAFDHYRSGNQRRRARLPYDAEAHGAFVRRSIEVFTPAFFAGREGQGCADPDPIFIVGLPRSGSTLVEQILASHPAVEGADELPDLTAIARRLAGDDAQSYPACLARLGGEELTALGQDYLERARPWRRLGRPLFVDKFPGNFLHIGLIRLILPRATIIDARRHPMACCLSAYKQLFAEGQAYSYDLADLGRYYRDYLAMMAHYDAVQPGAVHRVVYERLVADPEAEVRALLAHCGLGFEPQCLRFHETRRPVRTASSEQVRQPLFTDAVDHWRAFEPWLGALSEALGPAEADYGR